MQDAAVLPSPPLLLSDEPHSVDVPEEVASYKTFWPWYLAVHSRPVTKACHAMATVFAVTCATVVLFISHNLWWPVVGFLAAYALAWTSHLFVQGNAPATFQNPYWSFFADFEMCLLLLTGQMPGELARILREGTGESEGRRSLRLAIRLCSLVYLAILAWAIQTERVSFHALWA